MVQIDECRPTRVGRTVYDESIAYSTLEGAAGYRELLAMARRLRINTARVTFYDGPATPLRSPEPATLLCTPREVLAMYQAGAVRNAAGSAP